MLPLKPSSWNRAIGIAFYRYANAGSWDADIGRDGARCECCGTWVKNLVVVDTDLARPMHGPGIPVYGIDCFTKLFGSDAAKAARAVRNAWRKADAVAARVRDGWLAALRAEHGITAILHAIGASPALARDAAWRARADATVALRLTKARESAQRQDQGLGPYLAEVLAVVDAQALAYQNAIA